VAQDAGTTKRTYEPPKLIRLGSLAELTLGKTGSLLPDTLEFTQGAPPSP
jgi:hypothetical protein